MIRAKVVRECAVGPPGECAVQVELVGVDSLELRDLEDQVEAQGISFVAVEEDVDELEATDDVESTELEADNEDAINLMAAVVDPDVDDESPMVDTVCPLEPDIPWPAPAGTPKSVCELLEEQLTERLEDRVSEMARALLAETLGQEGG